MYHQLTPRTASDHPGPGRNLPLPAGRRVQRPSDASHPINQTQGNVAHLALVVFLPERIHPAPADQGADSGGRRAAAATAVVVSKEPAELPSPVRSGRSKI